MDKRVEEKEGKDINEYPPLKPRQVDKDIDLVIFCIHPATTPRYILDYLMYINTQVLICIIQSLL